MASVEDIVSKLKRLSPEQIEQVDRIVSSFSEAAHTDVNQQSIVPARIVDQAVQHGWPAQLFVDLIGSIPDFERPVQPDAENRVGL